jgi:hypothetical protein
MTPKAINNTLFLTIHELLNGAEVKMPPAQATFRQAPKVKASDDTSQPELGLE